MEQLVLGFFGRELVLYEDWLSDEHKPDDRNEELCAPVRGTRREHNEELCAPVRGTRREIMFPKYIQRELRFCKQNPRSHLVPC